MSRDIQIVPVVQPFAKYWLERNAAPNFIKKKVILVKRKQQLLKTIIAACCSTVVLGAIPISASAATMTQDGINSDFSASASESESIDAKLLLTNTNKFDLEDVSVEVLAPSGYSISSISRDTLIPQLKTGEEISFEVVYEKTVDTQPSSSPQNNVVPVNNITPQTTPSTTPNTPATTTTSSSAPGTGDNFPTPLLATIALASGAVAFLCIKKKKGKKVLSLFICAAMCGTMAGNLSSLRSDAADSFEIRSFTLSDNVAIGDSNVTVSVKITYKYPNGEVQSENISFNLDEALHDDETGTYYLFDEKNTLSGTIRDSEHIKSISYSITDRNNTELMSGELPPSDTWSIDDLGLIVGDNNITLTVDYDDNTSDTSAVKINNLCEANMQTLDVDRGDNDSDGVLNFIEVMYHTDPEKADSDDDTLTDYDEMAILGTDPMKADSDENGTDDAAEDFDGDGISNYDELYTYNTDPVSIDSDGDGISDYDELFTYKTDPNKADTDGDEADDYWEIQNGFDPLTFTTDFGNLDPHGNTAVKKDDGTEITVVLDDAFLDESTPGYMGISPYHVDLGDNSSTDISIPFNASSMGADDDPTLYYFNEETQRLEEVPTTITEDGQAVATIDKSGMYVLLNRRYVSDVWENDIIPPSAASVQQGNMDIVFVIDRSASMDSNDPDGIRKQVVKEFIEKMRPEDRAAIVQFTAIAETIMPITNDKEALINAVDSIENSDGGGCGGSDQNAGTNGGAGLRNALDELSGSTAQHKYIIFLTDGADTTTPELPEGAPEGTTYYNCIESEANGNVIIHTIGLVGTGDVNTDILKEIADATSGNYYLATTGVEAENVPEDVLGLEDVYKDIESITIDRVKDSNGDGITDYYTKLICEGNLVTSKGTLVFGGASYDEVQANADFDGDGLLNGEEVVIMESEAGVYAKVNSYPFKADSDRDGLDDCSELRNLGSSPLKYNSSVFSSDVDYITNSDYFVSNSYLKLYNESAFEQGSVAIGNAFFGCKLDQTHMYQAELITFFETITEQEASINELSNNLSLSKNATFAVVDEYIKAIAEATDQSASEEACDLLDRYGDILGVIKDTVDPSKELTDILPAMNRLKIIDCINSGDSKMATYYLNLSKEYLVNSQNFSSPSYWTTEHSQSYLNQLTQKYLDTSQNYERLNNKVEVRTSKFEKISTGLDVVMYLVSIGTTAYSSYLEYDKLMANLEAIKNNIYILDSILASDTTNVYLRSAASNIKRYMLSMYNDDVNTISGFVAASDYMMPVLEKALMEDLHLLIASNPIGAIVEIGRAIANIWGMEKMCEQASKTVAAAQTADIIAKVYRNHLDAGDAFFVADSNGNTMWVAYSDYSLKLYTQLLNVIAIRSISESEVSADEFKQNDTIKSSAQNNITKLTAVADQYGYKMADYLSNAS